MNETEADATGRAGISVAMIVVPVRCNWPDVSVFENETHVHFCVAKIELIPFGA